MKTTILLADDHTMFREGLRLLLEAQPDLAVIGEAADGRAAVNQAKKLTPDVALVDIFMPGLNGIDATERICEVSPSTQVIILSMNVTTEHIFRAFKAGAKGYLLKEMAGEEVIKAVRSVKAGKRYLCSSISEVIVDDFVKGSETVAAESPLMRLSPREREILQLLAEGKNNHEIAQILNLSPSTTETYRFRLMQKLGLRDLAGIIRFAIQHGLITVG
jgi:DNA-binding NarL/FixJ family response regulator